MGRAGGQLFLYNPQKGQIQAYPESCLWEDGPGCPGTAVLCHHDAVSSWGTSAKISVTYHICILIRITGAFIPAVGHMVPVSDISSCLPEVPIWLAGHCVRVRAASGGSRDHKQRTGDICDTDIGGKPPAWVMPSWNRNDEPVLHCVGNWCCITVIYAMQYQLFLCGEIPATIVFYGVKTYNNGH